MGRASLFGFYVGAGRSAVFPLDMLRKAECWPATTADAVMIEKVIRRELIDSSLLIKVMTHVDPCSVAFNQYAKRWDSFGWEVLGYDKATGRFTDPVIYEREASHG